MRAGVFWSRFVVEAPGLAASAEELWGSVLALDRGEVTATGNVFVIAYLATIRPDGSPRLHPFCPIISHGRLFAAIPPRSPKGDDLRRDGRCAIHALPGRDDLEMCIRAHAHEVTDAPTRDQILATVVRSGVTGMIATTRDHPLFEFDLVRVDVARWLDVGQEGTRAERQHWAAPD